MDQNLSRHVDNNDLHCSFLVTSISIVKEVLPDIDACELSSPSEPPTSTVSIFFNLGEGKNTLKIAEQITGQYGTNIVLGPYAKLKNIDTVEVGGSLGLDNSQASISGRTSLTMDIDVH